MLGVYPHSKNLAVMSRKPSVTQELKWLLQGQTDTAEPQVLLRFLSAGKKPEVMSFSLVCSPHFGVESSNRSVFPHYTQCVMWIS